MACINNMIKKGKPDTELAAGPRKLRSVKGWLLLLLLPALTGCLGMPAGVSPVQPFELNRYLGTWYEIARLDHSFERGLEQVSAEYSLRDDGSIRVVNRGFSPETSTWKEAKGRAYFARKPDEGYLKVSFFGPFYGSYVVFGLDQAAYQYAFVSGPDTSYLWLLAREPEVPPYVIDEFRQRAGAAGFDVNQLIFVKHR